MEGIVDPLLRSSAALVRLRFELCYVATLALLSVEPVSRAASLEDDIGCLTRPGSPRLTSTHTPACCCSPEDYANTTLGSQSLDLTCEQTGIGG